MNGLMFTRLTAGQTERFHALKTTVGLQAHGPLDKGGMVAPHDHGEDALYMVEGDAQFLDGGEIHAMLGKERRLNAVRVPAGFAHGWLSLQTGTTIEHVLGAAHVSEVLAAA